MNKNLKGLNWSTVTGIKGHFFMHGRVALIIQILFYVVSSLKLVSRHNKRVSDYFSDIEGKTVMTGFSYVAEYVIRGQQE